MTYLFNAPLFVGGELIHPSWLLCVYQRMFHSENKAVIKEGVMHLLGLQMPRDPAFAFAFSQVNYYLVVVGK